jgi:hypothetical protein
MQVAQPTKPEGDTSGSNNLSKENAADKIRKLEELEIDISTASVSRQMEVLKDALPILEGINFARSLFFN